jgi:hypothetical protein
VARLSHAALSARFVRASAAMAADAAAAASVEAATAEATTVEIAEFAFVKPVVEVVIVRSAIEISANNAAEADATVIGPPIAPVRIIPGGIIVVVVVARCGHDAVWR